MQIFMPRLRSLLSFVNSSHMLCMFTETSGQLVSKQIPMPELPTRGHALAKSLGCGVCGTDLLKINNRLLKQPLVLGHEWVGEIVAISQDVTDFSPGDRIVAAHHAPCGQCPYCLAGNISMCAHFKKTNFVPGGFSEFLLLSPDHLEQTTFKIQKNSDWREFIFTEPLACCVRNLQRLSLLSGQTAVVIGLGTIGLMTGALFARQGLTVLGIDTDAARLEKASDFGFEKCFLKASPEFLSLLREKTEGRLADVVTFTAGPASLVNESLSWLRAGGTLNIFSHLGGDTAPLNFADVYHREINLVTAYSASPEALRESFAILTEDKIKLRRLLSPAYSLLDLQQAVDDANARRIYKAWVRFD